MARKVIHSTKFDESAQDLIAKLLEFQAVAAVAARRPIHASELLVDTIAQGNVRTGHLYLIEDTLTDGSKVYGVRIN
jgi:hypothetical protein